MGNDLKELRRSSVVSVFGPGAVVDFRAGNAPVSGVACGLEEWDQSFPPPGTLNPQLIHEERLQKKLTVHGFRLPPLINDYRDVPDPRRLVAARFPLWLQCPDCNLIKPEGRWDRDPGQAYRYCAGCTGKNPARRKTYVIPVRFVLACTRGHLDEFPWDFWVNHEVDCKNRNRELRLKSEGPGLAGLILSCPECNARRSMDGIFTRKVWERYGTCRGYRPWLAGGSESCDQHPVTVQRGASNLYFPVIESALSIPPWTDSLQEILGTWWSSLINISDRDHRKTYIGHTVDLQQALGILGMTSGELADAIERRITDYEKIETDDLLPAEYRQFLESHGDNAAYDNDFEIVHEKITPSFDGWISTIVRAVRLREVRVIRGFTRIHPPGEEGATVPLSDNPLPWLPAIEIRGEGIFFSLDEDRVQKWEGQSGVVERAHRCDQAHRDDWRKRYGEHSNPQTITPRYMLCHTLAHALIQQLTLECGYSTASLRERVYASTEDIRMAGVLVYTATSDADGTLGGLQRLGRAWRLEGVLMRSIRAMRWCSSDPLCITNAMGASASYSHSACHACVLLPETSCEAHNRFLDRAFLVGLPDTQGVGFFEDLVAG